MTIEQTQDYPTHIYYVDDVDGLPKLSQFISERIERMDKNGVKRLTSTKQVFKGVSKTSHFQLWTMVEPGVASEIDVVLQIGKLTGDNGVLSRKGDMFVSVSATWANHKLENERIVLEACFNPTDDWFPILVGMFSPIVSAGVNSALVRLGL